MSIEHRDFQAISASDLQALVDAQESESERLEFKAQTYGATDSEKHEFAKDVSAFANAHGGHLVIGLREDQGVASALCGLDTSLVDSEILRLQQLADSRIEPRIPGLKLRGVRLSDGTWSIVVRVPRSWNPPHRARAGARGTFFLRRSNQVVEASMEELRALFTESTAITSQARAWLSNRIALLANDPLATLGLRPPFIVLHLIPVASLSGRVAIDPREAAQITARFQPMGSNYDNPRYSLEGYINTGVEKEGYTRVLRDGILESVHADAFVMRDDGPSLLGGARFERAIAGSLPRFLEGLSFLDVPPPILVSIAIVGARGIEFRVSNMRRGSGAQNFPCDLVTLPQGLVENYGSPKEAHAIIRPAFDALWNMIGFPQCESFNEFGQWIDS